MFSSEIFGTNLKENDHFLKDLEGLLKFSEAFGSVPKEMEGRRRPALSWRATIPVDRNLGAHNGGGSRSEAQETPGRRGWRR
jgi:hypothetical protein